MLLSHQPFSSSSCARVVTVLQRTLEFVEKEQYLQTATALHCLGAEKSLFYQVSPQQNCKPNLLQLHLVALLFKRSPADGEICA